MKKAVAALVSALMIIGAALLFWHGSIELLAAQSSQHWPETQGTIIYAEFEYHGTGSNRQRSPIVRYRYEVNDTIYESDRIAFGPKPNNKGGGAVFTTARDDEIRSFARLREGTRAAVYFNPDSPTDSVLLPGGGWFVLVYYLCGLLVLGFGVLCLLMASGRLKA